MCCQIHVELVAVQAHVDVVEGAHGRPAILVGKLDGDDSVALHLLAQGLEFVEGGGDGVTLLRPEALAVEEAPGVVVVRDEVHFSVGACRSLLHGVRVVGANLLPHVVDGCQQALLGVVLHAVAGEPREGVVGTALQVRGDLVLEVVVGDHIGADGDAALLGEGVRDGLVGGLGNLIG